MRSPRTQEETLRLMGGVRRFARLPTKVGDKWIFWKEYYEFYDGYVDNEGRAVLFTGARDSWIPISDRLLPDDALLRKLKGPNVER